MTDLIYVDFLIYEPEELVPVLVPLFALADADPFRFQRSCQRIAAITVAATRALHPQFFTE